MLYLDSYVRYYYKLRINISQNNFYQHSSMSHSSNSKQSVSPEKTPMESPSTYPVPISRPILSSPSRPADDHYLSSHESNRLPLLPFNGRN
ncbi:hypothetical protein TNIN_244141 [Trichonephila inaurata madagascariensis]|uniref:Uncharacterized protein n=1 Tax=Trichonephila inaurata madagascariensis TaxID=2747483 RepID=A0A8X6MG00_9ARAC|nr:hypothetical protein TNIN_244141 [Trichonephila inaurata madagascariensis]